MAEKMWQLAITANDEKVDLIQGLLTLAVTAGWREENTANGGTIFSVSSDDKGFLTRLEREVAELAPGTEQQLTEMDKLDWQRAWREFFTPVECGSLFVILPPWLAHLEHPQRKAIIIEPKSAFGTGHHASTRLCLAALSDLAAAGRLKRKGWALDLGCGSGVLGIAVCKLGMDCTGIDIDPVAITNAKENRELNETTRLELLKGDLDKVKKEKFDLVMANILAGPLIEMAADLAACVKPEGILILGGILDTQAEAVAQAYATIGVPKVLSEGEWRALVWA